MRALRRAALRKLAASAYEMNFDTMSGEVTLGEDGRIFIGNQDITDWLHSHLGEEVTLVIGTDSDDRPVETRTCRTCGRDYTDMECPHCRANRLRLRGV